MANQIWGLEKRGSFVMIEEIDMQLKISRPFLRQNPTLR